MIVPDANLLIYAYNEDVRVHAAAANWLEKLLSGTETVGFSWVVMLAFLRISTKRGLNQTPLYPGAALDIVDSWLNAPPARVIHPTDRHTAVLRDLMEGLGITGDLASDAHLAALAIEHGALVHSADSDFARFPGLDWANPLTGDF